ncbi:hypothetical protein OsJ_01486 [Oryza sativa Japonica Group]|uniref:Uncharacterized protein n=2 Tax=Oryza TaxID=4527 RepID=A2ZSC7_ORYSJ|nr:hypothetical protein OsJ_01486 [Oryza sativa Japonica Group]
MGKPVNVGAAFYYIEKQVQGGDEIINASQHLILTLQLLRGCNVTHEWPGPESNQLMNWIQRGPSIGSSMAPEVKGPNYEITGPKFLLFHCKFRLIFSSKKY